MRRLRDYQVRASAAFDRALERYDSALIVHPTGTGKTCTSSDICKRWGERGPVLFMAHRVELLDQAAQKFAADLGYLPQVVQAGRRVDLDRIAAGERVVIGSVQTLRSPKRLEEFKGLPFGLVLIDEAHHAVAKIYRQIIDYCRKLNPTCKVGGVTAFPKRTDKRALGVVFDSVADQIDSCQAIRDGWLVAPLEEKVYIDGVDFSKVQLAVNQFGEVDYQRGSLEALLIEEEPLWAVAGPLLDRAPSERCLVFTAGVPHAHLLADILNRKRPGSAAAIDGTSLPPGHPERARLFERFAAGQMQYLCNFNIATEGYDCPECGCVAIARPTKSLSVLVQMLGRCLRPLPGVVDGLDTAFARRAAIARSAKPSALALYYGPRAVAVESLSVADALGGDYRPEVVSLARELQDEDPKKPIPEQLERAQALWAFLAEEEQRKRITAEVSYRTERVTGHNAADAAAGEDLADVRRGGSSDKQIQLLIGLGVQYATAAGYGKAQAGAVIDDLRRTRCTERQRALLRKFGEPCDVGFDEAKRLIDAIAANGWRPLAKGCVA